MIRQLFPMLIFIITSFIFVYSSSEATPTFKNKKLYNDIKTYGEQNGKPPVDATIDRVWKAIPGYNGLIVNVEVSYKRMEKSGVFDASKVIYEEVAPRIHLDDLDPEPIYKGNPKKPMATFLINVAWGNEYIPTILNILREHDVKATFFLDGSWVKKHPNMAKQIHTAGHEIGNHAYSHPDLNKKSEGETREELSRTSEVIKETFDIYPKWFAPPSGSFNESTVRIADELNMKTILWTVDTVDWKKPETSEMVQKIINNTENGAMILMHPTKPVAEGLSDMIAGIKEKDLELGTVSDLFSEKRINLGNLQPTNNLIFMNE